MTLTKLLRSGVAMNPNTVSPEEVDKIMRMWSQGMTYAEIGDKVGRTVRSVESLVSRRRGTWTRDFNFPHILHAKRFGA
jgi:DNA-directed RNA polymerase specialized sigma24 family protein